MADLKLPKLPNRAPTRLAISIMPDLHHALHDYAAVYAEAYGDQVPVAELIPFILSAFLDNDRAFQRSRRDLGRRDPGVER